MSENGPIQSDLDALKALQADASELERIESLLDRFNVFEAIGFVGQEVMHSRFLAFLLDPKQNHGLGALFLRGFLRKVSGSTDEVSLPETLVHAHGGDLNQTTVRTEVHTGDGRIDILLLNEAGKWAMIVENKIWTTEHSDQLNRYFKFVKDNYPGWQVFGSYLTPDGTLASLKEKYLPLSYGAVCEIVDGLVEDQGPAMNSDVKVVLEHYTDMLKRRIVGDSDIVKISQRIHERHKRAFDLIYRHRLDVLPDSEIVRLSQQIHEKHKRAFDLIYRHRLDVQPQIRSMIVGLIRDHPRMELDNNRRDNHKFGVTEWDTPTLLTSTGWVGSKRILRFVFHNKPRSLDLQLALGPGPDETRQRILAMARANPDIFVIQRHPPKWYYLYTRVFLNRGGYEELNQEEREEEIRRHWDEFLDNDLPRIEAALRREAWI